MIDKLPTANPEKFSSFRAILDLKYWRLYSLTVLRSEETYLFQTDDAALYPVQMVSTTRHTKRRFS